MTSEITSELTTLPCRRNVHTTILLHRQPPTPGPQQKHPKYEHHDLPTPQQGPLPGGQLSLCLVAVGTVDEQDIDGKLMLIYTFIQAYIDKQGCGGKVFAPLEQFKMIVKRQQSHFLELVGKAAGPGANDDDREALLQHGMCSLVQDKSDYKQYLRRILGCFIFVPDRGR